MTRRVQGCLLSVAAVMAATETFAQTAPSIETPTEPALPADVSSALDSIEDFSFGFSQPGFYAVVEHLKAGSDLAGLAREPTPIDDWRALLERPAEFRGRLVTVEGVVGRNTQWRFEREEHRHLGLVWQLELSRAGQPIAVTLILTEDASDIPLGATIRVTGYFIMVRQYYSQTNRVRQAALVAGHGPTLITQSTTRRRTRGGSAKLIGVIAASTAAALIVWLVLRRSVARHSHASRQLRSSGPAPESLADDLAAWAADELSDESDSAGEARDTDNR